jgi:type IV pilus assembly protein PilB
MLSSQALSENVQHKGKLPFGELLVSKQLLTHRELLEALNEQRQHGGRLGEVLTRLKILDELETTSALAEHLGLQYIHFDGNTPIDVNVARMLPENFAKRFCLVAVRKVNQKVLIAMADPLNVVALDTVRAKINQDIEVAISSAIEIHRVMEEIYHGCDLEEQRIRDLVEMEIESEDDKKDLAFEKASEADINRGKEAIDPPVISFVNLLLSQAVKSRASDIHIEPREHSMSIRMRIDGLLHDMVLPPPKMRSAIIMRIKILSKMDIAEHRLPQDGRFKIKASNRDIDVRVSVIPIIYGEKVVLRILDSSAVDYNIDHLGFEPNLLAMLKSILSQPHGIIVVTGPTGSGKSTTLYSVLNYLRDPHKNITTVEDPVEYRLDGINQIQVKSEINLDFATSLRSILRQDPDIILVGEIRDKETVEIAIKASLTGHLVLSTFHTNDAPSAISRFVYMGIEPYLLASTLNLVIAQRLVRKICEHCKEPAVLTPEQMKRLKISGEETGFYQGKGCNMCRNTGYTGRLPIFEFLVIDSQMREKLIEGAGENQIRKISRQKGAGGLLESGVAKMRQGLTTADEVIGATFSEDL